MSYRAYCVKCKRTRNFDGRTLGDQMDAWYAEGWRMVQDGKIDKMRCPECAKEAEEK